MNEPVHILMIDDEPRNLDVLETILESPDYVLVRALSVDEALRLLIAQEFALLVLDIRMPGTSGLELAQMLKRRRTTRHLPIIFLTAYYNEDDHVLQGYDAGAVDYIRKPCNPAILRSKVAVFVDLFRKNRALEAENQMRRLAEEELRQKAEQLRMMAAALNRAKDQERKRLAQVLHDGLQQLLVAARIRVLSTAELPDLERRRAAVGEVQDILDDAIQTSRSLTAELNPPVLYNVGVVPALDWLGNWMKDKHGVDIELAIESEAEPQSEVHRVLLFEAARELLFNAVKHAGGAPVRLSLTRREAGEIDLVVEDRGPGFEASIAIGGNAPSGGLGLLCLRERVEPLGGRLDVASSPGNGARICVSLPGTPRPRLLALPAVPLTSEALVDAARDPRDGSVRVLLADDHKVVREGIRLVLTARPGIEIVGEAEDGEKAVELALALRPDVVVMDVFMPRMNGIEATRRIVERLPGTRVIGLSMHQGDEMAESMKRAGASDYLSKDGPTESLVATIRGNASELPAPFPSPEPGIQPPAAG